MAQLMEYAEYLSKNIGPRPVGTEEEQQAALYITERFQKDVGFSAQIEEFTSSSNIETLSAVPGLVIIVVAILAMIFPVLAIPAFILAAASAALYALEAFGRPIVSRALARGASQNVVAKYQPNAEASGTARGRTRKVVLVAHYDSGKVTPGLIRTIESVKLPVPIGLVIVAGMVLAAFFLLLHVFVNTGVGGIVVNVLTVIMLVICAYPVLRAILLRAAPYNEGANNNATGAAALLEVARRISRGSVSEADLADDPAAYGVSIHGEAAARESGLVPEGAQIRYEAEQLVPPSEIGAYDDEGRLLAAKAAIAAMTGQPVEKRTFGSVATHLVNSRAQGEDPAFGAPAESEAHGEPAPDQHEAQSGQPVQAFVDEQPAAERAAQPAGGAPASVQAPQAVQVADPAEAEGFKNAPSWFVSAQQNAKKPEGETGPVQRSRYAEAIEAAEREAAAREAEAAERVRLQRELELKAREKAARAAIEQNAPAATAPAPAPAPASEADLPAEPEQAPQPVFVPFSQAVAEPAPVAPVEGAPADDEFAASLGSTTAFDPRQLQAANAEAHAEAQPAPAEKAKLDAPKAAELPAVDAPASVPETTSPSRSGMFRKLRVDVPSMSGVIRMQQAGQDVSQPPAQQPLRAARPDVAAASAVRDAEAVDYDMSPAEIEGYAGYDAGSGSDDAYDGRDDYGDPAYDEPGQVEMPKSRAGGLLGRFRRSKHEDLEQTPQEWLDVDEDFDARTVGRERGGWESFRDDAYDGDGEGAPRNRRWDGGSYSRVRLGRVDTRSGEDTGADAPTEVVDFDEDRQIADEIEQIYHFRNPLYNTEVWFVALGSENMLHDGAKAFLAEHADDLRGSMIIEVESLGLGELCTATAEGRMRRISASSRVKRYTRSATAATGIAPGSVDLTGSDSAASVFQAAGFQAMHLLGVEDGQPALKGSADDVLENVDDLLLDDNVNFLMELLKK